MRINLNHKITIAIVAVAIVCIILAALLVNLSLTWNFGRYLGNIEEERNRLIVDTLTDLYSDSPSWQSVRMSTMYVGSTTATQIRVFDLDNRLIADSLPGMMRGMQGRRWENVQANRGPAYVYSLSVGGQRIGSVEISHLDQQGIWTTEALLFRRTVQASAIVSVIAAIILAALVGSKLSRRLTGRLAILSAAAEGWGQGRFHTRVRLDGDDELTVLGATMDKMAARLDEQSALRKKLTGDISHELRTPLTTIQSYLEAFRDGVLPADSQHLQAVLEESLRLGQLIAALAQLSAAELDGKKLQKKPLNLTDFLLREAERYRVQLVQKQLTLQTQLPAEAISIHADEELLARVIGNLISNAAKYTPEGGQVMISLDVTNQEAVIRVRDTGIGIDASHLPYVFERFYRVDPSRTRATGGAGIGLAIVRELVEAMDGRVDVKSKVGEGSTFRLFFPLYRENRTF